MQNSGLAAALAPTRFSPSQPCRLFPLWHNISGCLVAAWLARRPLEDTSQDTRRR